jgi:hypothetical protein
MNCGSNWIVGAATGKTGTKPGTKTGTKTSAGTDGVRIVPQENVQLKEQMIQMKRTALATAMASKESRHQGTFVGFLLRFWEYHLWLRAPVCKLEPK